MLYYSKYSRTLHQIQYWLNIPQAFRRLQLNPVMGAATSLEVGSAEQAGSSDAGKLRLVIRKLMKKEVDLMVIETTQKVIVPIMEDLVRKVVREEIESAREKMLAGGNRTNTNTVTVTNERRLHLKFLDEVSEDVLTGKEIKGKEGTPIRVALFDDATEQVIENGQESSARVEILFLEAGDGNEQIQSHQDFISRIIEEGDKTKPHFAKSCHVDLKKGIGALDNAKLANNSNWTKNCKCRLGAQVVENFDGIKVSVAWTEPFRVSDNRGQMYRKHERPSHDDFVWRLNRIGKGGKPCRRLEQNKVKTVEQFLFLLSVHPQKLQDILSAPDNAWEAIVKQARTCNIDDEKIYMYGDSSDGVLFDAVGKLKGVIHDQHYVMENRLSEAEKDHARKLLLSAFENWKDRCKRDFFPDEVTLVQRFPHRERNDAPIASIQEEAPGIESTRLENIDHGNPTEPLTSSHTEQSGNVNNTLVHQVPCEANYSAANSFTQEGVPGCDSTIFTSINHCNPTEPGNSAQSISPSIGPSGNANDYSRVTFPVSSTWEQPEALDFYGHCPIYSPVHHHHHVCGIDCQYCVGNGLSEIPGDESQSHQQSNASCILLVQAVDFICWILRVKKRVRTSEQRDMHAAKRQRI